MARAVQMLQEHPDAFDIPDEHDIAAVEPGWLVKIAATKFVDGGGGERFWIRALPD